MLKVAPVSADLLIKMSLGIAAIGLLYFGYKKAVGAASEVMDVPGRIYDTVAEKVSAAADAVMQIPEKVYDAAAENVVKAGDVLATIPVGYGGT